jgi:site-specific DNA-methyltransferase (adenine-specific)
MRHPATFPDKLADDVIRCFSRPGDLVLDPMCGSGTTLAMALRAGRSAIGIEIAEDYATLARERIAREQGGSVLDNTLVA